MATQPLDIKQGPLLPMPADKPIQVDTGYTSTPDGLTTTGYTTQPARPEAQPAPAPVNVAFPHPSGDPTKPGAVVQFPNAATAQQHASRVWEQLKNETGALFDQAGQVVGAFSQGLGGPSTLKEAYQGVKNTPTGFAHPYESLKAAVSGIVGGLNSGPLLDAAKQSWDAGDKVTATRHFVNALIPFVGANSDLAGDELVSGQTGKAIGHTLAAVAPFILGTAEKPGEQAVAPAEARGAKVAGTNVVEVGKQLALRENGEAGLPGTVGEPFTQATVRKPAALKAESVEPTNPIAGKDEPATSAKLDQPDVPTFFSKAAQVATDKLPASASGDQILATLKNNGVKQSEMDWLGLPEYLQGKAKVSKGDLQQFIDEHKIQLEETTLGGREHIDSALADLRKQRDQAMAVNNRTYADDLRYHADTPSLFNAMKEGEDVDGIIAKMPSNLQESARKFVDSENQIRAFDKQIMDLNNQVVNKPTKFEQYTLPGEKENYKELLLRLPDTTQDKIDAINKQMDAIAEHPSAWHDAHPEWEEQWDALNAQRKALQTQSSPQFKSGHFDDPNVLAHVRFDDRTMPDGQKALFLEEVQSDWHQKGKQEGYKGTLPKSLAPEPITITKIEPSADAFNVTFSDGFHNQVGKGTLGEDASDADVKGYFSNILQRKNAAAQSAYEQSTSKGVPDAPFKNDWHELALKRMLRFAAEKGYDTLAWTTGEQQADRYDLSKQISKLEWHPVIGSVDGRLWAFDHDGNPVMQEQIHPSQIADYVGKDAAKKLLEAQVERTESGRRQWQSLSGVDLKVGGEWAKNLYDRAIPNFLSKYTKKWGGKVTDAPLSDTVYVLNKKGNEVWSGSRNDLPELDKDDTVHEPDTVHTIQITPAMKKSVLKEGQPIAKVETPPWQDTALRELGSQAA